MRHNKQGERVERSLVHKTSWWNPITDYPGCDFVAEKTEAREQNREKEEAKKRRKIWTRQTTVMLPSPS